MNRIKLLLLAATGTVFLSILAATLLLAISLNNLKVPPTPQASVSEVTAIQEAKAKEILNYQNLTRELAKQKTDIFDLAITKTLLPLFNTLMAGVFTYIIAKLGLAFFSNYLMTKKKAPRTGSPT